MFKKFKVVDEESGRGSSGITNIREVLGKSVYEVAAKIIVKDKRDFESDYGKDEPYIPYEDIGCSAPDFCIIIRHEELNTYIIGTNSAWYKRINRHNSWSKNVYEAWYADTGDYETNYQIKMLIDFHVR